MLKDELLKNQVFFFLIIEINGKNEQKNIKINESLLFNFPCLGKRLLNVFEKLLIILILLLEATSAISLNSPKKFNKEHS